MIRDNRKEITNWLAGLSAEYAIELPEKISKLAKLIKQAQEQADDPLLLKESARQAHMLRGTAPSYGFTAMGITMGTIEDTLRLMFNHKEVYLDLEAWAKINQAIVEAGLCARRAVLEIQKCQGNADGTGNC